MRKFAWILGLFLVGCANMTPMAVNKQTKNIDANAKSIVLMTLDLGRPEASRYTPHPIAVTFTKKDGQGTKVSHSFTVDSDAGELDSTVHNKFMFRFGLEPGKYEMATITGDANAFPFHGFFVLPLLMEINVTPKSVTYVGRVTALMRPRVGDEFRAGSVIPLLDQSVSGVSGSTFDVTVQDLAKEDIAAFKSTFPSLADITIQTELLPPFDRAKAQAWWEGDNKSKEVAAPKDIKQAQQ